MQSTLASTYIAGVLGCSSRNYCWNSIKLCKTICVVTSCPPPPECNMPLEVWQACSLSTLYFLFQKIHIMTISILTQYWDDEAEPDPQLSWRQTLAEISSDARLVYNNLITKKSSGYIIMTMDPLNSLFTWHASANTPLIIKLTQYTLIKQSS